MRRAQFLAFKSDVEFWRRNKSLEGLSVRTLFMEVVFQVIILMSLIEEEASLLVTVPSAIGIIIQVCVLSFITGALIDVVDDLTPWWPFRLLEEGIRNFGVPCRFCFVVYYYYMFETVAS